MGGSEGFSVDASRKPTSQLLRLCVVVGGVYPYLPPPPLKPNPLSYAVLPRPAVSGAVKNIMVPT